MFSTTCFNERKCQYRLELKCVALVWAVLVVVFLPYWSSFFLGNHDFRFVRYGIPVDAGFFEGRFTQFVVPWLLSDGQILPAWNVFLGFAFLAGAAVKTASWFGLPKKGHVILTFALSKNDGRDCVCSYAVCGGCADNETKRADCFRYV